MTREVNQTMLQDAGQYGNTGQILDFPGQNLANAGPTVMVGSGIFLACGLQRSISTSSGFGYMHVPYVYEIIQNCFSLHCRQPTTRKSKPFTSSASENFELVDKIWRMQVLRQPRDGGFKYFCLPWH